MSHNLPPAVDHKEDLKRLAKSKDFVNHIIPKCARTNRSFKSQNTEKWTIKVIFKEYMWLLSKYPGPDSMSKL